MKNSLLLLSIVLLAIVSDVYSAKLSKVAFKKTYEDAEYYYLFGEYDKALQSYQRLLESDTSNANLHYKLGMCYLQNTHLQSNLLSMHHFEKAIQNVNKKYKDHYKETAAPTHAYMYYGDALRINFRFDDAIESYKKFLSTEPDDKLFVAYVNRELKNCYTAKQMVDNPVFLSQRNQFREVDRKESFESCPVHNIDENAMVFSYGTQNQLPPDIVSLQEPDDYKTDDIYFSQKINGEWTLPRDITSQLGVEYSALPVAMSGKGDVLILVQDDNDNGNLYESKYVDGRWTKMIKMPKPINSRTWETHATLSADGNTMFFSSDRKGGLGGFDIYQSTRERNGKWSKPINLGSDINTPYDEDTPNLAADGNGLYFSSQGHESMGGFDIFMSELIGKTWTKPQNVGYPLNTPGNDLAYITKYNGQIAFAPLNNDLLRDPMPQSPNTWYVVLNHAPVYKLTAVANVIGQNGPIAQLSIDTTGLNVKNWIQEGNSISFETTKKQFGIKMFAQGTDTVSIPVELAMFDTLPKTYYAELNPVLLANNESKSLNANNGSSSNSSSSVNTSETKEIYFGFDQSQVKSDFEDDVLAIYQAWQTNQNQNLRLEGYADPMGASAYNLKLSQKRADSVKAALIKMGVPPEKIESIGRGETSENPDNAKNRKVVISFIS